MKEMVGGCCVCSDDRGWPENPLVYCDGQGCTVAVHQACYGIVTVPSGNWYCRKCESPERTPRPGAKQQYCELCPSKDGAIKRTDNNGWAHVVCALYIPEVRFGNVTTMEPILLQHIPAERFNKACYICEESGKGVRATVGACMQCNKAGCKQTFHVTCAQALGLLCEEAGNYLDNVKYCGYCQHHYSKLKKASNLKTVPPYRPVSADSSPSPDKDTGEVWQKPQGKRKLSTSGKSSSSTSSGGKSASGGKSSGSSSPAPTTEVSTVPTTQESTPAVPTTTASLSTPSSDSSSHQETTSVNGKFTTSNFVESVVTPTASVFGDSGKSGKKRKSQAKDESSNQPQTIVSPASDEKRAKISETVTPPAKTEASTPSVLVKVPTTAPSTTQSTTVPSTKPANTTAPAIAATSSIVVSVPLAVASLPANPVTAVSVAPTTTPPVDEAPAKRGRVMPVSQIKESPPSSPDSKQKVKKHSREEKDKVFHNVNGVNAPHMLGNQLNPASTMAQKMSDTLSQEMEAHSIFSSEPNLSTQPGQLVGPQLHSRVIAQVRGSGAGTPQSSATSQSSGTPPAPGWGPNNASTPQTLDQLLERQWEQGSQFLMEQAQHFDIASLLTCLHQLRAENLRLEEHVNSLLQRRDHLLAVNARLAIPLVPPTNTPPVNAAPRLNNSYPPNMENGPTSPGQVYHAQQNPISSRHHSPGNTSQPYVCTAPGVVVRSTNVTSAPDSRRSSSQSGGSHPPTSYPSMYSVQPQQSQIVMRREVDLHHQNVSKPS